MGSGSLSVGQRTRSINIQATEVGGAGCGSESSVRKGAQESPEKQGWQKHKIPESRRTPS